MEGGHWDEIGTRATRVAARGKATLGPNWGQRGSATSHTDVLRADSADLSGSTENSASFAERNYSEPVDGDSRPAPATTAGTQDSKSEDSAGAAEAGGGRAGEAGSEEAAHF